MKIKNVLLMSMLVIGTCMLVSCSNKEKANENTATAAYYTCPMHPEIHKDAPGQCPICGMDLVKKD